MALISGPGGPIECLVTGSGTPVTLFAHGFAGSIDETRPFGSRVAGSRVFFHFRGHGATAGTEGPWTYAGLAAELSCVRDTYDARRGLGVSFGAGALLRSAVHRPDAFERLVVVLPPAIDEPRDSRAVDRVEALAALSRAGDLDAVTDLLLAEQPTPLRGRRAVRMWARGQAQRLSSDALRDGISQIPMLVPLENRSQLAVVTCPVLVIGQDDDAAHPSRVVHELVEALPDARKEIFSPGGVLWTHRAALRGLVSGFLNASDLT